MKHDCSLTVTRARCSTFGHGPELRRQERRWDTLRAEGVARFPFPPHGRIPNFAGAELAAARLLYDRRREELTLDEVERIGI